MSYRIRQILFLFVLLISCIGCRNSETVGKNKSGEELSDKKGKYNYDLEFLRDKVKIIELVRGNSRLILVPEYQGRVMTSTSSGINGSSYGWINYELISGSVLQEHFNPFGGEERIWLGPEGGQFSVFFRKGDTFNLENWNVPAVLDTQPFDVICSDSASATFSKEFSLQNYSGTVFDAAITRTVMLLEKSCINDLLGIKPHKTVSCVGYRSVNSLKNTGTNTWDKAGGALSIWMLSMLKGSPETTVVLPFRKGENEKIVTSYFGDIPVNRLKITDNAVFFLVDGLFRSKIGIAPENALSCIGSYDSKNYILTIIVFDLPENKSDYVNSTLKIQDDPFHGDVINSFNSGLKEEDPENERHYELEISSPAAFLRPGEEISHIQTTFHFNGPEKYLDELAGSLLKVSIEEIKNAFGKKGGQ